MDSSFEIVLLVDLTDCFHHPGITGMAPSDSPVGGLYTRDISVINIFVFRDIEGPGSAYRSVAVTKALSVAIQF
jgi:hypothetical protein